MRPAGADQDVIDLTRWNRAGLSRFSYVADGAAEFTEYLRLAHLLLYASSHDPADVPPIEAWQIAFREGRFPGGIGLTPALAELGSKFPRVVPDGTAPPGAGWSERLLTQYQADLTDPAAQISRAFARALHILSRTLDAYANEGYLRTATQPRHLNELLSLTGFRPRPAASATMPIAYLLKPTEPRATLLAGTAVQQALPDDGGLLVFEALEDITAHPSLNAMNPVGWDQGPRPYAATRLQFTLQGASAFSRSLPATAALLVDASGGGVNEPVWITAVDRTAQSITVLRPNAGGRSGDLRQTRLRSGASQQLPLRKIGMDWVNLTAPPPVTVGSVIMVGETRNDLVAATITEIVGRDLKIRSTSSTPLPAVIHYAFHGERPTIIAKRQGSAPDFHISKGLWEAGQPLGEVETLDTTKLHVEGPSAGNLSGIAVLSAQAGNRLNVLQLSLRRKDSYGAIFDCNFNPTSFDTVWAGFQSDSALVYPRESTDALVDSDGAIRLPVAQSESDLVTAGRQLLLIATTSSGAVDARLGHVARTTRIDDQSIRVFLQEDRTEFDGLILGTTLVHGNVATFGHGRSLPARVLGSGDASQDIQRFDMAETPLSTRPDPAFESGVAADLSVSVGGQVWVQVSPDTAPSNEVATYAVESQSDGRQVLRFNRRLPTGKDNIRLEHVRSGAGASGNLLPAQVIRDLQPKDPRVSGVIQPLAPQGGADLQDAAALRRAGGTAFALMDRAVTVGDFARLAEGHTGVWHAHSELDRNSMSGGVAAIKLTVVPAGGGMTTTLETDLRAKLASRSMPGTLVSIVGFTPATITCTATLRLRPGFAADPAIRSEVTDSLLAVFGLQARMLGATLYTSELVAVIEAHPAVGNVSLNLSPGWSGAGPVIERSASGAVTAIVPDAVTSVYLADSSAISLTLQSTNASSGGW